MGQLLVRGLDDEVVALIRQRAAANGRSVEAEHRAILETAVRPSGETLIETSRRLRGELEGRDLGPSGVEIIRALRDGTLEVP